MFVAYQFISGPFQFIFWELPDSEFSNPRVGLLVICKRSFRRKSGPEHRFFRISLASLWPSTLPWFVERNYNEIEFVGVVRA